MSILTIDDLKTASDKEVEEAKKQITIKEELYAYQRWLNQQEDGIVIPVRLGGSKRGLGIHPSSVSKVGACPYKVYLECTGDVKKIDVIKPEIQDTFDLGTAKHTVMQAFLHEMYGDQFQDEVKLTDKELHIHSHADGLFSFPDVRFILEIKTIKEGGSFGFDKVRRKPMVDHVRQTTMYMKLENVPFGLIYYYNKNTSEVLEHVITYDPEVWMTIEMFILPIIEAAYGDRKPPLGKVSYGCRWCGYSHSCAAYRRKDVRPTKTFQR